MLLGHARKLRPIAPLLAQQRGALSMFVESQRHSMRTRWPVAARSSQHNGSTQALGGTDDAGRAAMACRPHGSGGGSRGRSTVRWRLRGHACHRPAPSAQHAAPGSRYSPATPSGVVEASKKKSEKKDFQPFALTGARLQARKRGILPVLEVRVDNSVAKLGTCIFWTLGTQRLDWGWAACSRRREWKRRTTDVRTRMYVYVRHLEY
jgi:hypothetical protein